MLIVTKIGRNRDSYAYCTLIHIDKAEIMILLDLEGLTWTLDTENQFRKAHCFNE
jgi:hypothetical protein